MSLSVFPNLAEEQEIVDSIQFTLYNPNVDPENQTSFSPEILSQSNGDFLDEIVTQEGTIVSTLNGMYEYSNLTFNCDIQISKTEIVAEVPVKTIANIELISYSSSLGYTASQLNQTTIRINGRPEAVFTDQIFTVLLEDLKTIKNINAGSKEKYAALVAWQPPTVKETTITHKLLARITYEELLQTKTAIQTISIPQKVRWRLDLGVNSFRDLLSKGTI